MPFSRNNIKDRLKTHRVTPDAVWVQKTRTQLLEHMRIRGAQEHPQEDAWTRMMNIFRIMVSQRARVVVLKPMAMIAVVLGVAVGGWTSTVDASPADPVRYSVKLAVEKMELAFVPEEEKTKVHLRNAKRRAEDIKKAPAHAAPALKSLEENVASAKETVQESANKGTSEKITESAKNFVEQTEGIVDSLTKTSEQTGSVSTKIGEELSQTKGFVNEISDSVVRETVENLVQKGEDVAQNQEVKQLVEKRIQSVEDRVNVFSSEAAPLPVFSSSTDPGIASSTTAPQIAATNTPEQGAIAERPSQSGTQSPEAKEQVTQAKEFIQEAKGLIEQGNVLGALDKLKEAKEKVQTISGGTAPNTNDAGAGNEQQEQLPVQPAPPAPATQTTTPQLLTATTTGGTPATPEPVEAGSGEGTQSQTPAQ